MGLRNSEKVDASCGAVPIAGYEPGTAVFVPLKVNADGELVINLEASNISIGKVQIDQTTPGVSNGVTVNGSKRQLKKLSQTYGTAVAAAGYAADITITPTVGCIGIIKALGTYAPIITGSTGNHEFYVLIGGSVSYPGGRLITATATGITALNLTPTITSPTVKDVSFTVDCPLVIKYNNATNLEQSGTRYVYVLYEEVPIVS